MQGEAQLVVLVWNTDYLDAREVCDTVSSHDAGGSVNVFSGAAGDCVAS